MSDAHETLAGIIDREAKKLDKLSLDNPLMLGGAELEQLEHLARCIKLLRIPASVNDPEDPAAAGGDESNAELIKQAT